MKETVKETKQMGVELTHQELALERKTLSEPRKTDEKPVDSRTEIKIPLKKEEVESTKQSYVKEEVVATKKQIKETRNVSEELTSEKITEVTRLSCEPELRLTTNRTVRMFGEIKSERSKLEMDLLRW